MKDTSGQNTTTFFKTHLRLHKCCGFFVCDWRGTTLVQSLFSGCVQLGWCYCDRLFCCQATDDTLVNQNGQLQESLYHLSETLYELSFVKIFPYDFSLLFHPFKLRLKFAQGQC